MTTLHTAQELQVPYHSTSGRDSNTSKNFGADVNTSAVLCLSNTLVVTVVS